jgi:hypothetical protein
MFNHTRIERSFAAALAIGAASVPTAAQALQAPRAAAKHGNRWRCAT